MTDRPPSGRMEAHEHVFPLRVYYEDTDAGGIVYNASYVRFAERARTEMLRHAGFSNQTIQTERRVALAVRHLDVDFLSPAKLDDALILRTRVEQMGGATIKLIQEISCGERPVCRLVVTLVCLSLDSGRPRRIPDDIRAAFEAWLVTLTDNEQG